jgi:hypothetical protein
VVGEEVNDPPEVDLESVVHGRSQRSPPGALTGDLGEHDGAMRGECLASLPRRTPTKSPPGASGDYLGPHKAQHRGQPDQGVGDRQLLARGDLLEFLPVLRELAHRQFRGLLIHRVELRVGDAPIEVAVDFKLGMAGPFEMIE